LRRDEIVSKLKRRESNEVHQTSVEDFHEVKKAQGERSEVEYAKESDVLEHPEKATGLMLLLRSLALFCRLDRKLRLNGIRAPFSSCLHIIRLLDIADKSPILPQDF
jgi:hypothetical protein